MTSTISRAHSLAGAAPPSLNRDGAESLRAEAALVARAMEGDRAAWRDLYLRHKDFVYRVAFRFLGSEAEARDASQDVFVQVFASASRYRPGGKFTTYLWRVTANRTAGGFLLSRGAFPLTAAPAPVEATALAEGFGDLPFGSPAGAFARTLIAPEHTP
jgi:Sigma-70 region 2